MSEQNHEQEDHDIEALVSYIRGLGLEGLARDISDERFARRILENQVWLNSYDIQKSIEDDRQANMEQRLLSFQSQLFDKAANYNNIVISFGYAGFFAIWNFVSNDLHAWDTSLIAVLLGSSLLVFIGWTLTIAFLNSFSTRRIAAVYSKEFENKEEKIEAIAFEEELINRQHMKLQKVWFFVFFFTVATGFLAGIALILLMLGQVIGFPFDLYDFWEAAVGPPEYYV